MDTTRDLALRDQIASLEDRLERVELRRTGLPAATLLGLVLSRLMLWTEIQGAIEGVPGRLWIASFATAAALLLAVNEVTARRTIRRVASELQALRESERLGVLGRQQT